MNFDQYDRVRPLSWKQTHLSVLDQRVLPHQQVYIECANSQHVVEAIQQLAVRGAPAIGIAGAYGFVLAAKAVAHCATGLLALDQIRGEIESLANARPTAVNLRWALDKMSTYLAQQGANWLNATEQFAQQIEAEDLAANRSMGVLGAELLPENARVLTHCNTGSLATAGFGTALGVIRAGVAMNKITQVYASETRPWLQGSRLTIWELLQDGIDATLIVDSASAYLMQQNAVDFVIVGADRICANGDVANKIGTYAHALAAKAHGVKVMVVAPSSTVDMQTQCGADIHIEQRTGSEITHISGIEVGAKAAKVYNPVFDITPANCIDYLITEKGVIEKPDLAKMQHIFTSISAP